MWLYSCSPASLVKAALVLCVLAASLTASATAADFFLVDNCLAECPDLADVTMDVVATCDEADVAGYFECECYRPFMTNWVVVGNATGPANSSNIVVDDDAWPICRHAFSFGSGGLLFLQ